MTEKAECWALLWMSENRRDGKRSHIIRGKDCLPALFRTRREARDFRDAKYGYIGARPDLQREPHGWKPPKVIRVTVEVAP